MKKRFLERRRIPTKFVELCKYFEENPASYIDLFNEAWSDVFKAIEGQEIKIMNDEAVINAITLAHSKLNERTGRTSYVKVDRLIELYHKMKRIGFDLTKSESLSRSQRKWYRDLRDLTDAGIALATLQNVQNDSGEIVIPIYKLIKIDFSDQVPAVIRFPMIFFSMLRSVA